MGLKIPDIENPDIIIGSTTLAAVAGDAPAVFAAGTSKIIALPRLMPASRIGLSLTGSFAAPAGATATRDGAIGVIQSVQLLIDQQIVAELTGAQLSKLTRIWTGREPYATDDVVAAALAATFDVEIMLPLDIGSYLSLLDLPVASSASIRITWGTVLDIADDITTPGASTLSADTQCAVMVYGPTGFAPRTLGGPNGKYWRHLRQYTTIDVTQSGQVDHWLSAGRYYDALTIMQTSAGAYTAALVTGVTVRRGSTEQMKLTPAQIRSRMTADGQLDATMTHMTDVLHIDFARGAHRSELVVSAQNHLNKVTFDVTASGGVDKIDVVESWFELPVGK